MRQRYCVATLTRDIRHSGTGNVLRLIVNRDDTDVVNQAFNIAESRGDLHVFSLDSDKPEDNIISADRGEARWYGFECEVGEQPVTPADNCYVRVEIAGKDLWRPQHILVFAYDSQDVSIDPVLLVKSYHPIPLAIETDIPVAIPGKLSGDSDEGRPSNPIRRVALGNDDTVIRRLLCIFRTAGYGDSGTWEAPGTDEPVYLRVIQEGLLAVDHTFPGNTAQGDFEKGMTNMYFAPVLKPITRRQLNATAFELGIKGDQAWVVGDVLIFGVDTESGRPSVLVPLVDVRFYSLDSSNSALRVYGKRLSTDRTEGVPSVNLPLIA